MLWLHKRAYKKYTTMSQQKYFNQLHLGNLHEAYVYEELDEDELDVVVDVVVDEDEDEVEVEVLSDDEDENVVGHNGSVSNLVISIFKYIWVKLPPKVITSVPTWSAAVIDIALMKFLIASWISSTTVEDELAELADEDETLYK